MADIRSRWNGQTRSLGSRGHWGMAIVVLLVLAGCAQNTVPVSLHMRSTPATDVLPHFSDWRAVYPAPM